MPEPVQIIVLAGPNGAGKSTAAARLVPAAIPFINADEIAKTLPNYPSQAADIEAGRLVLRRMDDLERERSSFAIETTLASRSLAARIARLRQVGYYFRLLFAFLPSEELAIERVAGRVRQGGHNIPVETIRRRYRAGLKNFVELYRPLADRWSVFDTSRDRRPRLIAAGLAGREPHVLRSEIWARMREEVAR